VVLPMGGAHAIARYRTRLCDWRSARQPTRTALGVQVTHVSRQDAAMARSGSVRGQTANLSRITRLVEVDEP